MGSEDQQEVRGRSCRAGARCVQTLSAQAASHWLEPQPSSPLPGLMPKRGGGGPPRKGSEPPTEPHIVSKGLQTPDPGARSPSPPGLTSAQPCACLELLPHSGPQYTPLPSGGDGAQADPWLLNHARDLIQRSSSQWVCGDKYETLRTSVDPGFL